MPRPLPVTVGEMYDHSVLLSHRKKLPPNLPRPHPTRDWPSGNLAFLEQYCQWLKEGGTSGLTIRILHLPMAGHVLGLALKPYAQLDLDSDIQRALDYILAKQLSTAWTKNCRNALFHFRRFLRLQRGLGEEQRSPTSFVPNTTGLPEWLVTEVANLLRLRMRNWRPARLDNSIKRFWSGHLRLWRFLVEQGGVRELVDLRRKHIFSFIARQQDAGKSASLINSDLRDLRALLYFLQDQGWTVPQSLLRIQDVIPPDRLPKFLTDDQMRLLRDQIEGNVQSARLPHQRRDALLSRAVFYLLWQGGMRLGEIEDLYLEDLDLPGRRLLVRQSKNLMDRTVFLTDTAVNALQAYLAVRGEGSSEHVFLYRNRALHKDLARERIKNAGQAVGVKVYPHRLRHTCATQLLNAGCKITSIQKFLGHRKLSSTMIYARVHDQTVSDDYYTAMNRVEQRLQVAPELKVPTEAVTEEEKTQILTIAEKLADPEAAPETRLSLLEQMRGLLFGVSLVQETVLPVESGSQVWIPPPVAVAAD